MEIKKACEQCDGDEIDGTHEGKIPSRILLGECPVLSSRVAIIDTHL